MSRNFSRKAMLCAMSAFAAALTGFASTPVQAGTISNYRVLHTFCQTTNCADGGEAAGAPAIDGDGNIFAVTVLGGRFGGGVLDELTPEHGGARYFKHVLKAFCLHSSDCGSGAGPIAGPILDASGNLYGTTSDLLLKSCGTVYMDRLSSTTAAIKPQFQVLHRFSGSDGCKPSYGGLDYQGKESGQAYDGASPLYGMTVEGGAGNYGVVFRLSPPIPGRSVWTESVVYSFCQDPPTCTDGKNPQANLVMDANGDLFGSTGDGKIFVLLSDGSGGLDYSVIHTSTTSEIYARLALASDGTTLIGVANSGGATGDGTLFSLAPGSCRSRCAPAPIAYQYTLLHDFCPGGGHCTDGSGPNAIALDAGGDIFGTTNGGGVNASPPSLPDTGGGVIFEYTHAGAFFPLYNFCAQANCADGGGPFGGLVLNNGSLYGTTLSGGATLHLPPGAGVVFELGF